MIVFAPQLTICGEAGFTDATLEPVRSMTPELANVDLSLAGGTSLDLTSSIREVAPALRARLVDASPITFNRGLTSAGRREALRNIPGAMLRFEQRPG